MNTSDKKRLKEACKNQNLNYDSVEMLIRFALKPRPSFYLFESKYPKRNHFTIGFKKLLKELGIKADLRLSVTRYAYDSSDNVNWVLLYGEDKERLEQDKQKLENIKYKEDPVFNITGNGYGTGFSVGLNINKYYN